MAILDEEPPAQGHYDKFYINQYRQLVMVSLDIGNGSVTDRVLAFLEEWDDLFMYREREDYLFEIEKFKSIYGFSPDDQETKRNYIDYMARRDGNIISTDEERDEYVSKKIPEIEMQKMLKMMWTPKNIV
jgi:hypothetical protein